MKMPKRDSNSRLDRVERDLAGLKAAMVKFVALAERMDERQRKQGEDIARLDIRLTGIEGQIRQLPTLWQIATLIFAIFSAAFVLLRFGLPQG